MKALFLGCLLTLFFVSNVQADQYVRGYFRKNGTYVQGHFRSNPNNTVYDNYSTYGNTNPYTGKTGTKRYKTFENAMEYNMYVYGNGSAGF